MIDIEKLPGWAQSFYEALPVRQQFILYENIYDFYPLYRTKKKSFTTHALPAYLSEILQQKGYESIVKFDPVEGFRILKGEINIFQSYGFLFDENDCMQVTSLDAAYVLIKKLLADNNQIHAIIIDFASHFEHISQYKSEYDDFLFRLFHDSFSTVPVNLDKRLLYSQVIYLSEKCDDIPKWYQNQKIRYIKIPKPDEKIRENVIRSVLASMQSEQEDVDGKEQNAIGDLISITNGMYSKEILNTLLLAKQEKKTDFMEFVLQKKMKAPKNPWLSFDADKIKRVEALVGEFFVQNKDVLIEEIISASFNLSNIESDRYLIQPRSSMVFAGYNQTAQRNLLEALSDIVFENRSALHIVDLESVDTDDDFEELLFNDIQGLAAHMREFPYGILLFENIQSVNQRYLKKIFRMMQQGSVAQGEHVLYLYGYMVVLGCNFDGVLDSSVSGTIRELVEKLFTSVSAKYLHAKLEERVVLFTALNREEAAVCLQKRLNKILGRIESLHKIKIILRDEVRSKILTECLGEGSGFTVEYIDVMLKKVFVSPFVNCLRHSKIKQNDIVLLKALEANRFEMEFA